VGELLLPQACRRVSLLPSAKEPTAAGKDVTGMTRTPLEMVEVDTKQLDEVLRRAEQSLPADDFELTQAIFESYAYISDLVEDKNTTTLCRFHGHLSSIRFSGMLAIALRV
jgi:hypothetical protein